VSSPCTQNIPGYRFGYCEHETAWTYSYGDRCDDFTATSAETKTFDIRTTLSSPWLSDNLVQLDPIQFVCVDDAGESSERFTTLDLKGNSLTGTLPTEFGNLSVLTYLDLSLNSFTGILPTELGKLSELTFLDLRENQSTGPIPSKLGLLAELTSLVYLVQQVPTQQLPFSSAQWLPALSVVFPF
jgi:hypothetical protein